MSTDLPNVDDLKAQASETVRKVSDQINEQANVLRDTVTDARYHSQEFIENNPWKAVAIAMRASGSSSGVIVSAAIRLLVLRATTSPLLRRP